MMHVLYHAHCADGFLAACIARRKLGASIQWHAVSYGEPVPDFTRYDAEVYILDFSYPRSQLQDLKCRVSKLVVLDHHATAARELDGLFYCHFDPARSGAGMAWDYFFPHSPRPALVNHIEDRDLGRPWAEPERALPGSLEIHAALMRAVPRTYEAWGPVLDTDGKGLLPLFETGSAILAQDRALVESIASVPIWINIAGQRVPAAQLPHEYTSEAAHALLMRHPDAPFACVWNVLPSGKIKYSLRSTPERADVSEIAVSLGGGGHRNAASFESAEPLLVLPEMSAFRLAES